MTNTTSTAPESTTVTADATHVVSGQADVASADPTAQPASSAPEQAPAPRWSARLRSFEEAARKRLEGTAAEKFAERAGHAVSEVAERVDAVRGRVAQQLPERLDRKLDGLLDRVGLVRKSRLPVTQDAPGASARPENNQAA